MQAVRADLRCRHLGRQCQSPADLLQPRPQLVVRGQPHHVLAQRDQLRALLRLELLDPPGLGRDLTGSVGLGAASESS